MNKYKGKRFVKNEVKEKSKNKIKKTTSNLRIALVLLLLIILFFNVSSMIAYFSDMQYSTNAFFIKFDYTVIFDANDGSGRTSSQQIPFDTNVGLTANTFTRNDGYSFLEWNTASNGSGTGYDDEEIVNNIVPSGQNSITLYAIWVQGVAEINGTIYDTLQEAVDDVPTDNTQTTIKLLKNVSENITVDEGQNITFNFQNFTVSNTTALSVITNNGTINITNGTLTTSSLTTAVINNNSTGKATITGGNIIVQPGGRQAIYNDKGTVEISGTAYMKSEGLSGSNQRATVQNQSGGTLKITGGTIISTNFLGVNNQGTMVIGEKDGIYDGSSPNIQGGTYGVTSKNNFGFYDGILKGKTAAIESESKINDIEVSYAKDHGTEEINSETYITLYLFKPVVVTFDANGGGVVEETRNLKENDPIGTLPVAGRAGYTFDGWFTDPDDGEEIDENIIITEPVTFFAHWTLNNDIAEINGVTYPTLKDAVNAVQNNTLTTIKLLKDANDAITIPNTKNIIVDLQGHTLSNVGSQKVFDNNGTLTVTNGTITSNADYAILDNNNQAHLNIIDATLIATGSRGAIYNTGGTLEISGNSYLSSQAIGRANTTHLDRGTVQNINNGTLIITGGTIIGIKQQAISNEASLTIGAKDGSVSTSSPLIIGKTYGIKSTGTFNFYDGIAEGITGAIDATTVSDVETGYVPTSGTDTYEGNTYQTEYLVQAQP